MPDDKGRLQDWICARGIEYLCVVSPHLDDAVFSTEASMHALSDLKRLVFTVFTEARPDSDPSHALMTGFSGPVEEFEVRREEDRAVMDMLHLPFLHAGACPDDFSPVVAAHLVRSIFSDAAKQEIPPSRMLILLPAGAGSELGALAKLARRFLRIPTGCAPHAQHEWVRDGFGHALEGSGATIGYYAEIPYWWADSMGRLAMLPGANAGRRFVPMRISPDIDRKYAAARMYGIQFEMEFGRKAAYQRRAIGIQEVIFLPSGNCPAQVAASQGQGGSA